MASEKEVGGAKVPPPTASLAMPNTGDSGTGRSFPWARLGFPKALGWEGPSGTRGTTSGKQEGPQNDWIGVISPETEAAIWSLLREQHAPRAQV